MILVELCAGSAALTSWCAGVRTASTYQGSKREWAPQVAARLGILPMLVREVVLVDAGEWGRTLGALVRDREAVAQRVLEVAAENDRALWERWRAEPPPADPSERAARHLYLQVRSFRAKPVWVLDDGSGWRTHGFDPEHDGRRGSGPTSNPRGWATPRPVLAERIRSWRLPWPATVIHGNVRDVPPVEGAVVYLDPPYVGTAGYGPVGLERTDVLEVAQRWARAGCRVGVSEGEAVGPDAHQLVDRRASRSFGHHQEWITLFGP